MRNKILIVDDEEMNRELLKQIFESDYEVLLAKGGKEAIEQMKAYEDDIAVVLLDLLMPQISGYQVLQVMKTNQMTEKIPVVVITANTDMKIALSCYSLGAVDFINKPFVAQLIRQRITNIVNLYRHQEDQEEKLLDVTKQLAEKEKQLWEFSDQLVETIGNIVEFRNLESGMHIKRVKGLTLIVAQTYRDLYPEEGLTDENIEYIIRASVLHDIGKISVPDHILRKPGELTEDENEIMKSHTTKGCEILNCLEGMQESKQYQVAYDVCRYHHERYDGSGYPDGLKGDDIPLSAQIVALADVYDALVSERIYKKACSKHVAYDRIMSGACGVFSPKILKCFEIARKPIELFSDTHQ